MEMVNGYVFLDLTKSNVYSKALKVLGTDKPVVIKDGQGSPYFVDSLTLDGTNIIITKGGKTITIANDNTITNVGDIQNHLYKFYTGLHSLNITLTNETEIYLNFVIDFNEDITNLFDELKTFTTSEKAFNDIKNILNKVGSIVFVGGADSSESGVLYMVTENQINVDFNSSGETINISYIDNINFGGISKIQLF